MQKLKVYMKTENRKKCMCLCDNPKCKEPKCDIETVEYDEYHDWQKCFKQNKYGK